MHNRIRAYRGYIGWVISLKVLMPSEESRKLLLGDSSIARKILKQIEARRTPVILATDIDRTFVLEEGTQEEQKLYQQATQELIEYLDRRDIPIVAVTSREIDSLIRDYEAGTLPLFDLALTSLGAERYLAENGSYCPDLTYEAHLADLNGWREEVIPIAQACYERVLAAIEAGKLDDDLNFTVQPRDRQDVGPMQSASRMHPQPFKISFNYFGDDTTTALLEKIFADVINELASSNVYTVFSYDGVHNERFRHNIDMVPFTKDRALERVIGELESYAEISFWIYAGDSRNDERAIHRAGDAAIVVGGFREDVDLDTNIKHVFGPIFVGQTSNRDRIIYIENDRELRGPQSLLKAIKAMTISTFSG